MQYQSVVAEVRKAFTGISEALPPETIEKLLLFACAALGAMILYLLGVSLWRRIFRRTDTHGHTGEAGPQKKFLHMHQEMAIAFDQLRADLGYIKQEVSELRHILDQLIAPDEDPRERLRARFDGF